MEEEKVEKIYRRMMKNSLDYLYFATFFVLVVPVCFIHVSAHPVRSLQKNRKRGIKNEINRQRDQVKIKKGYTHKNLELVFSLLSR